MGSCDGLAGLLSGVGLAGGLALFPRVGLLDGLRSLGSMTEARGDGRPKRRKTIRAARPYEYRAGQVQVGFSCMYFVRCTIDLPYTIRATYTK